MLVSIKNWYRPESITEALSLMKKGMVIPYAGGTSFHRGGKITATGMIDLRKLDLDFIHETESGTTIGACARFKDIANYNLTDGRKILKEACSLAASTSLRNLITIGGSLASKPIWSNIPAALLALNAEIEIAGGNAGKFGIGKFLDEKPLDGTSLITKVFIPKSPGVGIYYRYSETKFDYSLIDTAVYLELKNVEIETIRIAVGNLLPKARRLYNLEESLKGLPINSERIADLVDKLEINPISSSIASKEFRSNLVKVFIKRAFKQVGQKNA